MPRTIDKTRVGLPEIKVGLFPGGGGTQRVARLMQTGDALQMLFKGEQIRARQAKSMGLVHEVAPQGRDRRQGAKAWIRDGGKAVAPWDVPKFKAPSGKVYSPAGMMIWPPANAIYRRETHDNYPAAKAILASRLRGPAAADGPRPQGREPLLRQDPALEGGGGDDPHAVHLHGRAEQGRAPPEGRAGDPPEQGRRHRRRLHGRRRRLCDGHAGLDVVLVDQSVEAAEKGKAYAHTLITGQINKGRAKTADRDALLGAHPGDGRLRRRSPIATS